MNKKKILFILFTDSIVNSKLAAIISIIKENKMHRKKEQSQFEGNRTACKYFKERKVHKL